MRLSGRIMVAISGVDGLAPARPRLNPQLRLALRRVRRFVLSLATLLVASFAMLHLIPGDPVRGALGTDAPESLVRQVRVQLGLNRPLPVQFADYLRHVLTGDFGTSIVTRQPVSQILAQRLPATLALALSALAVTLIVAIPAGVGIGVLCRDGRRPTAHLTFTAVAGLVSVIPEFLLAVGLVFVFAVSLNWFTVAGQSGLGSYLLPVVSLAAAPTAMIARLLSVETGRVLREDYVRTARAKRLADPVIYLKHVLPNALASTLTISGLLFGGLIAGTVLVENVFAWPGLGSTMVSSIVSKDYPVVQAIVLVYGAGVLLVNLLVDLLLSWLDPRSTILER
jgi:peptide/nickel transport system permease protein